MNHFPSNRWFHLISFFFNTTVELLHFSAVQITNVMWMCHRLFSALIERFVLMNHKQLKPLVNKLRWLKIWCACKLAICFGLMNKNSIVYIYINALNMKIVNKFRINEREVQVVDTFCFLSLFPFHFHWLFVLFTVVGCRRFNHSTIYQ